MLFSPCVNSCSMEALQAGGSWPSPKPLSLKGRTSKGQAGKMKKRCRGDERYVLKCKPQEEISLRIKYIHAF